MKTTLDTAISMALACSSVTYHFSGSPGVGKTFKTAARFREQGYKPIIIACQNLPIEDTGMLPVRMEDNTVRFMPNEIWRPEPGVKIAIILDELGKAPEDVFNAFNSLLFGKPRTMQGFEYPADTLVIVTSNPSVFGAGDNIKPHHINRMVNLSIADPTADEAKKDMLDLGFDARVINWVMNTPQALVSFDEELQSKPDGELTHYFGYLERRPKQPFCSMRSIDIASDLVKSGLSGEALRAALNGCLGALAAYSLTTYLAETGVMVPAADMLASPETALVPPLLFDQRTAGLTAAAVLTKSNWKQLFKYAKRLTPDVYRSVFLDSVMRRTSHGELSVVPGYNREFITAFGE